MSWLDGIEENLEDEPPECCLGQCMTECMSQIGDKIFIGNQQAPKDLYLLKKHGVTHILSLCCGEYAYYPGTFQYKQLALLDHEDYVIRDYFDETNDFLDLAIRGGGKVMVHCKGGVSRSVSIVIAYLIRFQKFHFDEALSVIRSHRPIAHPNVGFQKQLREYENSIFIN